MEIIWILLAALGAGIGTGLAGLSAATVMVPILLVLCPSFAGETGAYQATAIALASDILGSAVTAWTYAKHQRIDLRRGWIMLVCIVTMCTVGSYAAFRVGNVVLGSFTLFLTFGIGLRFLLKPDTSRRENAARGERLSALGVAVSLFFGLTIGFGTGFVGTGGGMMMLVVFTAFLGMERKTAVGTSTLIMTFTALIAAASHMLIHPAILWEKGGTLALCIATTTGASLASARFANRVNNRTVGLVTGAVLTLLGGALLLLRFGSALLVGETLRCLGRLIGYLAPCVLALLPLRFWTKIPDFVFRKLLHMVAFCCFTVLFLAAESWQALSLTSLAVALVAYPVLALLEGAGWYARLFVEKSPGEIKRSLVMLFALFAVVSALAWGLWDKPWAGAAAILMWGVGDGAAALVGIPWGRHRVGFPSVKGRKSWEGFFAMLLSAFAAGVVLAAVMPVPVSVFRILAGAVVAAFVELVSPSEWDTVTVPVAILAVLLL